jgi:ABC-type branched-subunit amino acid transport system ATPase component
MPAMLETHDLTVVYGGVRANESISLQVEEGELLGLIGPNGAGKTTFIDAITGFAPISAGTVMFQGQDVTGWTPSRRAQAGLTRTFQSLELFDDLSVMDNLVVASEQAEWWTFMRDLVVPKRSPAALKRAEGALEILGLESIADKVSSDLSHGQRKLVAVARALAAQPKLVLVDEPAAGLDTAESVEFGTRLRRVVEAGVTVLLIDHDMGLVLGTCNRLCVLDFGRLIAEGDPDTVRMDPAVVTAYLGREAGEAQARHGDAIAAARSHAIEVAEEHVGQREEQPVDDGDAASARDAVLALKGLVSGYNGAAVVQGIDLHVRPGEVVALLGPNGAGKTTTLLTISGIIKPLAGEISVLGVTLKKEAAHEVARRGVAHVAEDRSLFFDLTVEDNLRLGLIRGSRKDGHAAIEYALELFPALQPLRKRKAGLLSGGEQQMLTMARAMVSKPKVLLVDELSLGLAPVIVERLLPLVRDLADASGCGVLLVEQHVHMALEIADRGYVMSNGRIALAGSARELTDRRDLLKASYLGEQAVEPKNARAATAIA